MNKGREMEMRQSAFAVLVMCGVLLAASAEAGPILDQFQLLGPDQGAVGFIAVSGDQVGRAQTFTAGLTGELDHIDVGFLPVSSGSGVAMSLVTTAAGLPTTTTLGSDVTVLPPFGGIGWTTFDFSAQNISLTAGESYAFVLNMVNPAADTALLEAKFAGGNYGAGTLHQNTNGGAWGPDPGDAKFRTYMKDAVPEPGSLSLLAMGGLLALRRRRN